MGSCTSKRFGDMYRGFYAWMSGGGGGGEVIIEKYFRERLKNVRRVTRFEPVNATWAVKIYTTWQGQARRGSYQANLAAAAANIM